ncbi:CHAT domain-containing protein [Actinoplanes flavus]|uniref:CHAT domain-containing protein n=1 Tax=Actinoplanes flavus TaxID=2820290 RepID=A0ABS3UIE5_9ACTN|nr:CHAT domain-containing protein [Actinoplanes flavus]MBO3737447.1 CHAT domain-containing protein [Actinoplanes flavus]
MNQELSGDKRTAAIERMVALTQKVKTGAHNLDPQTLLAELDELADLIGDMQPYAQALKEFQTAARGMLAWTDGDLAGVSRFAAQAAQARDRVPPATLRHNAEINDAMAQSIDAAAHGDLGAAVAAVERGIAAIADLDPSDRRRARLDDVRTTLEMFARLQADLMAGGTTPPATAQADLATIRRMAQQPHLTENDRSLRLALLAFAEMGLAQDSPAALDAAVSQLEQVVATLPADQPSRRIPFLVQLGMARLRRIDVTGARDDLPAATAELEEASELAATSFQGLRAGIALPLSYAYRLAGRLGQSRETAREGLRRRAWSVLLQARTADVHASARTAAMEALEAARWCLNDGDVAGGAASLDAARALILYAAIETRDLATRLEHDGQVQLAGEWRAAAANGVALVPFDLRRRVMAALTGVRAAADGSVSADIGTGPVRLLDPPSSYEIQAALRATGADALVYLALIPGDLTRQPPTMDGVAVVIRTDSPPAAVALPALATGPVTDLDAFLATTARASEGEWRDLVPDADTTLDGLCDWAWTAAIGPLLEKHLPAPTGRPPHIVLIPMGDLTRIPWHAARRQAGGEHRYAVQDAVFSYAASARLFCDAAWRSDVAVSDTGLIVGDPDTAGAAADLPSARAEALAVHGAFYGRAHYLGRTADGTVGPQGAGTPAEVRSWLSAPDGGTMLHLACHGTVTPGSDAGDTSYLLLVGGSRLAAEELVQAVSAGPDRAIGLAVLAACSSSVSGRGDDEAFSLSTTLLANGVRTVVGAQWNVPDAATSVLMFMFHHYLRDRGLRPAHALRAAQLWLLASDRQPPATMPAELRRRLPDPGAADTVSWAGFIHSGR